MCWSKRHGRRCSNHTHFVIASAAKQSWRREAPTSRSLRRSAPRDDNPALPRSDAFPARREDTGKNRFSRLFRAQKPSLSHWNGPASQKNSQGGRTGNSFSRTENFFRPNREFIRSNRKPLPPHRDRPRNPFFLARAERAPVLLPSTRPHPRLGAPEEGDAVRNRSDGRQRRAVDRDEYIELKACVGHRIGSGAVVIKRISYRGG